MPERARRGVERRWCPGGPCGRDGPGPTRWQSPHTWTLVFAEDKSAPAFVMQGQRVRSPQIDFVMRRVEQFDDFGARIDGANSINEGAPSKSANTPLCQNDPLRMEQRNWPRLVRYFGALQSAEQVGQFLLSLHDSLSTLSSKYSKHMNTFQAHSIFHFSCVSVSARSFQKVRIVL